MRRLCLTLVAIAAALFLTSPTSAKNLTNTAENAKFVVQTTTEMVQATGEAMPVPSADAPLFTFIYEMAPANIGVEMTHNPGVVKNTAPDLATIVSNAPNGAYILEPNAEAAVTEVGCATATMAMTVVNGSLPATDNTTASAIEEVYALTIWMATGVLTQPAARFAVQNKKAPYLTIGVTFTQKEFAYRTTAQEGGPSIVPMYMG